jgi:hypothetical protein
MQAAETRIAFVVRGVVQQALRDLAATHVKFVGNEKRQQELVQRWCGVATADNAGQTSISLSAANKTELLLGCVPHADVYPLGDLYASALQVFCGAYEVGQDVLRLAHAAGDMGAVDRALHAWLEERRDPAEAFAHIGHVREDVLRAIEKNRFHRSHMGVVPKIGARTLGIDLFI